MGTDQPNYDTVIISSTTEYEDSNTCDALVQVQRTSFEMVAESTESCSSKVSGNVHSQRNWFKTLEDNFMVGLHCSQVRNS